MRARSRLLATLAVSLAGLGLAGCGGHTTSASHTALYPITVEAGSELIEIGALGGLAAADVGRVEGFALGYRRRGEGDITVAYPSDQNAERTVEDVVATLASVGVPHEAIVTGPYSREADGDRGVVLSFAAPKALATECSNYFGTTHDDTRNGHAATMGCAHRRNLAAMVADPRDLLAPRPMGPGDAPSRVRLIDAYRLGKDTRAETRIDITTTE